MDLREARSEAGLTQNELAKKAGVTDATISALENGKSAARNNTRRRIEKALGVHVNWLQTRGLPTYQHGEMASWESVEQDFRKTLYGIKSLQKNERVEFIKLAKEYLAEFKEDLKEVPHELGD
ncbi:MAG: helix-turn-helix transcriptional regulator [Deltaproteobacteria bacterium]|nr:helix-turn-helix transcriptional regulator [Deltaproteobacteria bacterium]